MSKKAKANAKKKKRKKEKRIFSAAKKVPSAELQRDNC
jgi:hypothetical protein